MAAMFMAMAIMLLVGIHHDIALSPEQWITLNCKQLFYARHRRTHLF